MKWQRFRQVSSGFASLLAALTLVPSTARADQALLNVSYDATRELYQDYDQAFAAYWLSKTHQRVTVQQSHGGSGKQARAVMDGLGADVVTLALSNDIDAIQKRGLIASDWQKRLPDNSSPYTSTIVFLVRKGNPKHIRDWDDLARPGVTVVTPNPKTGGGSRWCYLAAWGYALKVSHGSQPFARDFVSRLYSRLYKNVPILDSGSRGSTVTFTQRHIGDVLLSWENEADFIARQKSVGQYQIIYPSISILAEPPVSVVDKNADAHHTRPLASAYLQYLYSPVGQKIAARHFYRPQNALIAKQFAGQFPHISLFTIDQVFGGWAEAQKTHFADGGTFDQIYTRH